MARQWADPAHCTFGLFYRAPSDPRLLVPLRNTNIGWMPNLSRPRAVAVGVVVRSGVE